MARAKRGNFVEEEQLGIAFGLHNRTPASAELDVARDPTLYVRRAHDSAPIVVQNAAVAHYEAAALQRDDLPEWGYAVLQRHR
jgi:hypothetical protein